MLNLLKGVRIVDLSTVVLGPYATQMLGDLGADVIKVEPPTGDAFRAARPARPGGDGAGFLNSNRNKRSIVLDLAQPDDLQTLLALVETADVFVHNLRPRSADNLGIGYDAIRNVRPDVVYCSARGFAEGPWANDPAYDDCIQAASGIAWLNASGGEPRFMPTIVCDKVAGLHLALSVAAGLASRARTGEGVFIETPMYETMVSFLMVEQLGGKTFDPPIAPMGYDRLSSPNRRPFATRDGYLAIMPYTAVHWQRYLKIIGREDMIDDPRVTDAVQRASNIDMLYQLIADASPQRTTAEWISALRDAAIPCAPVQRLEDLIEDPQLLANDMFAPIEHPREGSLLSVRTPFFTPREAAQPDRPAPMLGEHSAEIRAELSAHL